jgi:hypothetical protein
VKCLGRACGLGGEHGLRSLLKDFLDHVRSNNAHHFN